MSRAVLPVLLSFIIFFLVNFSKASLHALPDNCLEFDIAELEDYLSEYNLENVPTIDMMIGGFKCPVTALPFGALRSDWARLLLLQRAQPKESIFLEKLGRLFRILAIAYFRMEERFDSTGPGFPTASSVIASSTHKSGTNTDPPNQTKELDISTTDSRETDETPASLPPSTSVFNNERPTGATKIERTTFTSSNVTMREKQDDFHTILDDISSTTVAFSPVDNRTVLHPTSKKIGEKQTITVYANVTSFSDVITGKPKHTVISVSRTNERTETTEAINIFNSSSDDFTPVSTKDEPSENKDDSITGSVSIGTIPIPADLDVTDISGTTTSNKITASKNDPERGRTKSISPSKFNGRGDFPISSDHDDSDFNSSESEDVNSLKIFRVKTTSEQSRVYSDKISANGTVSSAESFNESRSNPRTDGVSRVLGKVPWNSSNSTGSRNKPKTPPLDDDFWKYIASSRKVTSTTPAARPGLTSKTKDSNKSKENSMKWRKRGSLNTNVEKNFRWFYNFGYEDQERSSDSPIDQPRPGVHIECNGKKHEDE